MTLITHLKRLSATAACGAILAGSAFGAVTLTEDQEGFGADWPGTVTWETYHPDYQGSGLTVSSSNRVSQTYTPDATTAGTVANFHFRYANTSVADDSYKLEIYEIDDANANPLNTVGNYGTKIGDIDFALTQAASTGAEHYPVLTIALTGSDQVTLNAGQSYAFELIGTGTGSMTAYRRSGSSSNGQGYTNYTPIHTSPRDVVMAYTLVPEPGSLALLGLGGVLMLGRRRAV